MCRELEATKAKAAASLQELMQIRSSLEASMEIDEVTSPSPSPSIMEGQDVTKSSSALLRSSLLETDALLAKFRQSLSSFHDLPLQMTTASSSGGNHSALSTMTATKAGTTTQEGLMLGQNTSVGSNASVGSGGRDDVALAAFLEKYSDRLVEIVGEKILNKVKP